MPKVNNIKGMINHLQFALFCLLAGWVIINTHVLITPKEPEVAVKLPSISQHWSLPMRLGLYLVHILPLNAFKRKMKTLYFPKHAYTFERIQTKQMHYTSRFDKSHNSSVFLFFYHLMLRKVGHLLILLYQAATKRQDVQKLCLKSTDSMLLFIFNRNWASLNLYSTFHFFFHLFIKILCIHGFPKHTTKANFNQAYAKLFLVLRNKCHKHLVNRWE